MKIGQTLEDHIKRPFHGRDKGKNGLEFIVTIGNREPHFGYKAGWTEWKNGRARRYHRAQYQVAVGVEWIREHFPISCAMALVSGGPVELDYRDILPPTLKQREPSFDMESEVLYAD